MYPAGGTVIAKQNNIHDEPQSLLEPLRVVAVVIHATEWPVLLAMVARFVSGDGGTTNGHCS